MLSFWGFGTDTAQVWLGHKLLGLLNGVILYKRIYHARIPYDSAQPLTLASFALLHRNPSANKGSNWLTPCKGGHTQIEVGWWLTNRELEHNHFADTIKTHFRLYWPFHAFKLAIHVQSDKGQSLTMFIEESSFKYGFSSRRSSGFLQSDKWMFAFVFPANHGHEKEKKTPTNLSDQFLWQTIVCNWPMQVIIGIRAEESEIDLAGVGRKGTDSVL